MESPMTDVSPAERPAQADPATTTAPLFAEAFNPAAWMGQQTRLAEACAAAGQKYLEGLQDVANQCVMLQTALAQQFLKSTLSLPESSCAGRSPDDGLRAAASAMESTVESVRDVMAAACKCQADTLGVFRQRLAGNGAAGGPAHGRRRRAR
jgi:hypothetical protein